MKMLSFVSKHLNASQPVPVKHFLFILLIEGILMGVEPYHTYTQKDFKKHPLLKRLLELHDIPKEIYVEGDRKSVV